MPFNFNIAIIKPLVKDDKKSNSDINNIRPISVSDTITNIYESLILEKLNQSMPNNDKQFGFKSNSSCAHAVFVLQESIKICKRNNVKAYIAAVDASKAFDKVNRLLLWNKLMDAAPIYITRTLIQYYSQSQSIVECAGKYSNMFRTRLGVKQGGPLSPRLFTIYLEDLISLIEKTKHGISIGKLKIDILLYADDILLCSTTRCGLQKLIKIVEEYGQSLEIKFNPSKTQMIIFNDNVKLNKTNRVTDAWQQKVKMYGEAIQEVDTLRYLGIELDKKLSGKKHIKERNQLTTISMVKLEKLGINSSYVEPHVKFFLYKTYIRPKLA